MISEIFTYIFLGIGIFIPIILWSYIFSFVDNSLLNKKRFLYGVLAWGISVIPILYMDNLLSYLQLKDLSVFKNIYILLDIHSYIYLLFSFIVIIFFMYIYSIFTTFLYRKNTLKIFIQNFYSYGILIFFLLGFFFLLQVFFQLFPSVNIFISKSIYFEWYIYNSLKLVIFYYIIIAFIEESSKYFHFLWIHTLNLNSIRVGILGTIFIALWFSFIENIIYIFSIYSGTGVSSELIKVWFFRSIFSTMHLRLYSCQGRRQLWCLLLTVPQPHKTCL